MTLDSSTTETTERIYLQKRHPHPIFDIPRRTLVLHLVRRLLFWATVGLLIAELNIYLTPQMAALQPGLEVISDALVSRGKINTPNLDWPFGLTLVGTLLLWAALATAKLEARFLRFARGNWFWKLHIDVMVSSLLRLTPITIVMAFAYCMTDGQIVDATAWWPSGWAAVLTPLLIAALTVLSILLGTIWRDGFLYLRVTHGVLFSTLNAFSHAPLRRYLLTCTMSGLLMFFSTSIWLGPANLSFVGLCLMILAIELNAFAKLSLRNWRMHGWFRH